MKKAFITLSFLLAASESFAQSSGNNLVGGITTATSNLTQLIAPLKSFFFVMAAITAFYGGVRVYTKFQNGDQDTNKAMGQWGFGFVFLLAMGFIISAFFGV